MADNFAQTVKQQADILKIIGDYVRLKKAGAQNYTGLCPFHSEKTPSSPSTPHASSTTASAATRRETSSPSSRRSRTSASPKPSKRSPLNAASRCRSVNSLRPKRPPRAGQRAKLIELHEIATRGLSSSSARPKARSPANTSPAAGLAEEGIAKFRIGYAPEIFHALRDRLQSVADAETLRASGLFSFKPQEDGTPGPLYSRFRKRITFPIANESGRIIAFTARALEAATRAGAKYLNSPETVALHQGQRPLQSGQGAQAHPRKPTLPLLVEGQMDCISAYLAGITNVLATSGTAFTEAQVRLLSRYTKRVIINFDPDTAGANAAEKSIALLTEEDFEVKVVALEGGLDPDRYIRERGAKEYAAALRAARRHQDYLIDRARQLFPPRTPEAKIKALNFLLPHIRRMPSRIARDEFAADSAQKLGIDAALVLEELKQAAADRRDSISVPLVYPFNREEKIVLQAFSSSKTSEIYPPPRRLTRSMKPTSPRCAPTCMK